MERNEVFGAEGVLGELKFGTDSKNKFLPF